MSRSHDMNYRERLFNVTKLLPIIQDPLKICITGAAGRIAYSLIQTLSKGDVFGHDQVRFIPLNLFICETITVFFMK